ncbi:(E,E)-geranyllinalool synthase-like [Impatiens glandulifera]|uniref:(E,E)-geranyllinalool synthase-like n=1 Tax=Impatiens glandulifera TaxID=253017 RepID=UPI001FB17575|nr:(E,E)-geranyllinalool synthase-like [Impatiens glandulifera]
MATGNHKCLKYLEFVVKECDNGVPTMYPLDEELIKLYIINQIQRLGLAEHFGEEIDQTLETIHKSYNNHEFTGDNTDFTPINFAGLFTIKTLFPTRVSIRESKIVHYKIAKKRRFFNKNASEDSLVAFPNLKSLIDRDLNVPWMARLDHLDHRFWIEVNMEADTLWVGKASYYRLLPLQNDKLIQLAVRNYEFRQSIYRKELEELKRWSKDWGITSMGFGREKSDYCYFSIASATSLPHDSIVRMIVAKSSTVVTIADDFFDTKGSLEELQTLTQAFQRWDGNDLTSHSKKIFDVIDHLVTDISTKLHLRSGQNALENLREMWRVTIASWMKEATWSKMGYVPSMDEYLETGTISFAMNTMILPGACFLTPGYPSNMLDPSNYEHITNLLMGATRLLNDVQGYQKEEEEGKKNFVLLYLEENTNASVLESIAYVKEMIDGMKKKILKHALLDGVGGSRQLPKTCRIFHLSCLRICQMFFNSRNLFESVSDLAHDINMAIYIPLPSKIDTSKFVMEVKRLN